MTIPTVSCQCAAGQEGGAQAAMAEIRGGTGEAQEEQGDAGRSAAAAGRSQGGGRTVSRAPPVRVHLQPQHPAQLLRGLDCAAGSSCDLSYTFAPLTYGRSI